MADIEENPLKVKALLSVRLGGLVQAGGKGNGLTLQQTEEAFQRMEGDLMLYDAADVSSRYPVHPDAPHATFLPPKDKETGGPMDRFRMEVVNEGGLEGWNDTLSGSC